MFRNFRKAFDPDAPEPLPSYHYECRDLCDNQGKRIGTEWTLYGPPGHEGVAFDWLVENIIGIEAFDQRHEPGKAMKFRYFVENSRSDE